MSVAPVVTETTYVLEAGNLGPFATVWPYADAGDVGAWLDAADGAGPQLLAAPAQYTVASSSPLVNGGTVTLNGALLPSGGWSVGATLSLARTTSNGQPSVFGEDLGFSPAACEAALDNVERQVQELQSAADRAVSVPFGESAGMLPPADERAGMFLGFDAAGNPIMLPGTGGADDTLRQDLADPAAGASLVAYRQRPAAVVRTVMNRLRERVSFADFGCVCDGVTDDWTPAMLAIAQFSVGGVGIASGELFLPAPMAISKPLLYGGSPNVALRIFGVGARSEGVVNGSSLRWIGAGGGGMLLSQGAFNLQLDGINFDSGAGAGLKSCVHFASDNSYGGALTVAIVAGANRTANVASTSNLVVGCLVSIGLGTANWELVYVKSVPTGASFTADFLHAHAIGETVGGSPGSDGMSVRNCSFTVPEGVDTAGVLFGNLHPIASSQVSDGVVERCVFRGHGADGAALAGVKIQGGGNVKCFDLDRLVFYSLKNPIRIEGGADVVHVNRPQFENSTDADIWTTGINTLHVSGAETESIHLSRFIQGAEGSTYHQTLVLQGCSMEKTPPADGYIIDHGGSVVLLGNGLGGPQPAPILPKIRVGNINGLPVGANPSSIVSLGNYYGLAGASSIIFYDSSDNAMDYGDFGVSMQRQRVVSLGDHGDAGAMPNRVGALSSPGIAASIQTPAPGALYGLLGQAATGRNQVVVPYPAWSAAALTKDLLLFSIPPKTKIVAAWADTAPKFAGPGGTLLLRVGLTSGGAELLLDHNVSTAAVVKPAADADLGAAINRAGAVLGGALLPAGGAVFARLTSSSGNLSALNAGSVTITIVTERA